MAVDPWTVMASGDILAAVIAPFTNLLGAWFYGIIIFTLAGFIYLRTQDLNITTFVSLVVAVGMAALIPDVAWPVMAIVTVLGIVVVLHKLLTRG
jgi:hypothetical protein